MSGSRARPLDQNPIAGLGPHDAVDTARPERPAQFADRLTEIDVLGKLRQNLHFVTITFRTASPVTQRSFQLSAATARQRFWNFLSTGRLSE
jgi:hypothetical protein